MSKGWHGPPTESRCHEDKHKAPTFPRIHPLSLQNGDLHLVPLPFSVGKIHQDEMLWQHGASNRLDEYLPLDENLFFKYTACNTHLSRVAGEQYIDTRAR
jgi:hypothetical protein